MDLLGVGDATDDPLHTTFREIMAMEADDGVHFDLKNLSVLLDMPSPHLHAYPPETVVAEKRHAMVPLGRANSRMKGCYGVRMLASTFDLDPERMRRAIAATFARRITVIPTQAPDGLGDAFADDPAKRRRWKAFVIDLTGPVPELDRVVVEPWDRLMPVRHPHRHPGTPADALRRSRAAARHGRRLAVLGPRVCTRSVRRRQPSRARVTPPRAAESAP